MGVGPIPYASIRATADRAGISDFDRLYRLVTAMDSAYLRAWRELGSSDG